MDLSDFLKILVFCYGGLVLAIIFIVLVAVFLGLILSFFGVA